MLLAVAAVIIMFMIWARSDHESQLSTQTNSNTPTTPTMNEMVPPRIVQHPTLTYRITRWDLFANNMTIFMRNRILQVIIVVFLGLFLWSGLSRDFGTASFRNLR